MDKSGFKLRKERKVALLAGRERSGLFGKGRNQRFVVSEKGERTARKGLWSVKRVKGLREKRPAILCQKWNSGILLEKVCVRKRKEVAKNHGFFVAGKHQHGNLRHQWLGKVVLRD
jgi:hypothetical protein